MWLNNNNNAWVVPLFLHNSNNIRSLLLYIHSCLAMPIPSLFVCLFVFFFFFTAVKPADPPPCSKLTTCMHTCPDLLLSMRAHGTVGLHCGQLTQYTRDETPFLAFPANLHTCTDPVFSTWHSGIVGNYTVHKQNHLKYKRCLHGNSLRDHDSRRMSIFNYPHLRPQRLLISNPVLCSWTSNTT